MDHGPVGVRQGYGREDFNEKELLKGADHYGEESFDAADRKTKDRIEKQLERHEGKWVTPEVKFQGAAEADWLDAVANKIIDYNDTKDPKEFISRTERVAGQTERGIALEGFLDQNQALKFANATSKQIEWLSERSGVSKTIIKNAQTKYNAIPNSERRNFSLTENQLKYMNRKVSLQKKILERVNQGDTSIKQIAKNLKLSVAKVDAGAQKLYNNIYSQKLKINSPNLTPSKVYLPGTTEELNKMLTNLWKVDGFEGPEGRTWFKLIRDAKESDRITAEQFKTATNNVRNFFRMKNEIQAKYPDIILNLDHSLSFGALTGIGAKGEKFLTGVPSTETFNKGIKQVIDNKYATTLENIRAGKDGALEQKIKIEKLAKNLNIDIGEVSSGGKRIISLGETDIVLGEDPIPLAITEMMKKQTKLAEKLEKGIDPKLLEGTGLAAYFKKHKKLPKFSDFKIAGVQKIIDKIGVAVGCKPRGRKAEGGRIGFADGSLSTMVRCIDAKWERNPQGFLRATANIASKGLDKIWGAVSPLFFPASQIAMGRLEAFKDPTDPEMWWSIMLASDAVKRWGLDKATLSQLKNASWATRASIIGDLILKFPGDKILTKAAKVARPLIAVTETYQALKAGPEKEKEIARIAEEKGWDVGETLNMYRIGQVVNWDRATIFHRMFGKTADLSTMQEVLKSPEYKERVEYLKEHFKNKKEPVAEVTEEVPIELPDMPTRLGYGIIEDQPSEYADLPNMARGGLASLRPGFNKGKKVTLEQLKAMANKIAPGSTDIGARSRYLPKHIREKKELEKLFKEFWNK